MLPVYHHTSPADQHPLRHHHASQRLSSSLVLTNRPTLVGRRGFSLRIILALSLISIGGWLLLRSGLHRQSEVGQALLLGRKGLSDVQAFPAPTLKNLILVAGHSVFTGTDFTKVSLESSWYLESYQKVKGEANSFLEHIRLGVKAAAEDPTALLLFSGGQTRAEAGPRSEGLSYVLYCIHD